VGLAVTRRSETGGGGSADTATREELRANWPGFRGPEGIGISPHDDPPVDWDGPSDRHILWKVEIPLDGFNSPIIWGNRLFLSGADRRDQVVYCFDTESGRILWQRSVADVPGSPEQRPRPTEDTGYAAPTMATDGRRVFAVFATGDTAGFDMEGKLLWARNLGMPDNHYGHSSSLITFEDRLLVQFDQNTGGHLLALRSTTGETVYDTPREVEISWASPVLIESGGRSQLVLNSNPFVMAYDPRNGRELWRVRCMLGEVAPSPAFADGMVFAVNDYARLVGIRPGDEPEIAWEYIDDLSEVASPVAGGGLVFMAASFGALTCLDAESGEQIWLEEYEEGFYSSPILAGGNVYLMDMTGVMFIIAADREYRLTARCELGEQAVTTPAFMPGRIYIRGQKHLYCIGE